MLYGWRSSTLTSYNAAIWKFDQFKKHINKRDYKLPKTPSNIYRFVAWARRSKGEEESNKITV